MYLDIHLQVMPSRLAESRNLEVAQVIIVSAMATLRRRAEGEEWVDSFMRERRTARANIPRHRLWSVTQQRWFFTFVGHVAPLDETRCVRKVMRHRSLGEWRMRQATIGDGGDPEIPDTH